MKKLLFTFFGLILLGTSSVWGAGTHGLQNVDFQVSTEYSKLGWENSKKYSPVDLTAATLTADGTNGVFYTSNKTWRTYQNNSNGPVKLTAKSGYWIENITFTYAVSNNGILADSKTATSSSYSSTKSISIKGASKQWYTSATSGTQGVLGFKSFNMNYYVIPSSITLTSDTLRVGDSKTIQKQISPANASDSLVWSSSNPSVMTVDYTGRVTAVAIGYSIITATGIGGSVKGQCMVAVLDGGKNIDTEDFFDHIATSESPNTTGGLTYTDENGIGWQYRRYKKCDTTMIGTIQGIELCNGYIGYLAYLDAKQEGGVKSISFPWRAVKGINKPMFMVDAQGSSFTSDIVDLPADSSFANPQYYSKEVNFTSNVCLRVRNTNGSSNTGLVFGPITITPYLFFTNKTPSVNCASNQSFNLNTILINNTSGNKPAFSVTSNNTGGAATITNGVIDLKDVISDGEIAIKATWEGVSTTTTLSVTALPAPTSISLNVPEELDATVGNRFQIIATVSSGFNPNVSWSSSSSSVVSVDQYGVINVLGDDEAVITVASKVDPSIKATCTIKASVNTLTSITDTIKSATTSNWSGQSVADHWNGDGNIFKWMMRSYRRTASDVLVSGGAQATRMSYNTTSGHVGENCIAYDSALIEGGVKRISFQWKAASDANPVVFDVDNNGQPDGTWVRYQTNLPKSSAWKSVQTYSRDVNMDMNAQLRISIPASDGSTLTIGPLTITPYLLYTVKSADAYEVGYTNTALIKNIPSGDAVAYTLENNDGVAVINPSTGEITEILKEGTVTVKASWNEGKVYTTYQLTTHLAPAPKVSFTDGNAVTKSMNVATYTNTLVFDPSTPASGCGEVTYESNNEEVATIIKSGVGAGQVSIVGEGTATISVHIAKGSTYASKDTSYVLTVEDPNDDAIIEKFTAYKDGGWTGTPTDTFPRTGDYFDWNAHYCRHGLSDFIGTERATIFNTDGTSENGFIVSQDAVEGGIKRIGFNWAKNGVEDGKFQIIVGEDTCTVLSGATTVSKKAYNHNFFAKENATLKILNSSKSKMLIGDIKITPYIYYTHKDTTIEAKDYKITNYTNDKLYKNIGSEGSITYSIENAESKTAIATIDDATSGAVTIHGGGEVVVKATWSEGATTTYKLTILKEKPTVTLEGATIDAFGSYTAAPVAKLNGVDIENPKFAYKSSNELVATVDKNGVVTIHGVGTTNIRAILAEGDNYRSDSVEAVLTVSEPVGANYWKETFDSVPEYSSYVTDRTVKNGNKAVYQWQMRNFQHNFEGTTDKVDGEQGIRVGYAKSNYLAFNRNEEGGIQAVFFKWRLAGSGTATARFSRIMSTKTTADTLNIVRENISKGPDYTYSYAETLNYDQNSQFQVRIPQSGESVVFGSITIKPYLLYTTKDTTINVLEYNGIKTFTNGKLINNTGVELGEDGITYSIKSVTPAGAAEILEANKHNGQVTINGAGTAVVQAQWGDVTTTYTLNISGGAAIVAFTESTIDTTMNAQPITNNLVWTTPEAGSGKVKYTSSDPRIASVDSLTGVVTVWSTGSPVITANIAAGTLYKATTASYTLNIANAKDSVLTETFKEYIKDGWANATVAPTDKTGDYFIWVTDSARHKTDDLLADGERATWMNARGYLETKEELEGGIKRVTFNWKKSNNENNTQFSVVAGDKADTVIAAKLNQQYTYNRNLFVKKNAKLKIFNSSQSNASGRVLWVGEIKITPYIYFTEKLIEVKYNDVKKFGITNDIINNTNKLGVLKFYSSNVTVATVDNEGKVTFKGASPDPITITASWKESATSEDSVTATYQIRVTDKTKREAKFQYPNREVERGETPVNPILMPFVPGEHQDTIYSSSNKEVAIVVDNVIKTIAPGTTTIMAKISATDTYLADSCTYELTVTYTPEEGTYVTEKFKSCTKSSSTDTVDVNGDNGYYTWKLANYQRSKNDSVSDDKGTRLGYPGAIMMNGNQEGGIKEVTFDWRVNNSALVPHFQVTVGDSTHDYRRENMPTTGTVARYVHDFSVKENTALKIANLEQETPQQANPIIGPVKIIPYLLYTRKDTTLTASQMGGVYTFTNDSLINNTGDEVADNFTYTVRAKDNAVSIANEHSGQLTIIGAGTDTIQAAWEGVTTTYVVHVVLEDANLAFAKQDSTVMINAGSCTQVATTSSSATIKYEFEGEHDGAEITQDGTVTFSKTGEFHILATVPVDLPYNLDSARYTLTVNNKPTPEVEFKDTTVDMNSVPFVRPAQSIPASGMGQAHYSSDDVKIATVEELTGLITVIGEGTATISVHYDAGEAWEKADASFKVIVTDPMDDAVVENFNNETYKASNDPQERDGKIAKWEYQNTRRANGDKLQNGSQATWMNYLSQAHLVTTEVLEGGIKRVSFSWNRASTDNRIVEFVVAAGDAQQNKDTVCVSTTGSTALITPDWVYNHNFSVKQNAKLSISRTGAKGGQESHMVIGDIKITPYLYYTMRDTTIKVGESYNNKHLIDNRDDDQVISYSIIAGNEKSVATIDAQGNVSATRACELTIQAKWGTYDVTTTYHLSIVADKTTISFFRNDGTENVDVVDNNYGQPFPSFTLPTRTGYRFNAYWTLPHTGKGSNRFTVTRADGNTVWVASRYIAPDTIVDYKRNWVYEGTTYTFYADWRPERKIALDNQGATTAGTDTVVTAYCPNNNLLRLTQPITKPEKTNYTFQGYYTEANGAGAQLIDANGEFIKSVEHYTDSSRWFIKDADITLYAHWLVSKDSITLYDAADNHAILDSVNGETLKVALIRSFTAGEYNTICLPFDVNKTTMQAKFGENYELATLDSTKSASLDDAGKNLSIYIVAEDSIKAGMPYLIKLAAPVQNPSFDNVVIKCAEGSSIASDDEVGKQVQFKGLLSPFEVPANKSVLFVVSNDKLAWNATGKAKNMNGMRAYFHVNGIEPAGVAPRLVMREPTTPTELENLNDNHNDNRKVVINDQIYIIRNGVYYNVSGQIVK